MLALPPPAWLFDGSEIPDPLGHGERAVQWLRTLKHPKSTAPGNALELPGWQERIVRRIYGPRHPDDSRIVKQVIAMIPRGNRKTSLGAMLALIHAIGPERITGGEVICAAADQKQAKIALKEATGIITMDRGIASKMRIMEYQNKVVHPKTGTKLEAISSDAPTQHGRTITMCVADEIHAWKNRDLYDAIQSSLLKTPNTLLVVITTAGRGDKNLGWDVVDYARKIQRGEIANPAVLPIIFEGSADAKWDDESFWYEVNPGLRDGFPDIEGMREKARQAIHMPGNREAFRQLNLNVWLDHSADPFVSMDLYDAGNAPVDLDELQGLPCWLAVDLSKTHDLTAIVAVWRRDDGSYVTHPWFFCPKEELRARADRDGVPYVQWQAEGLLTATPGNVVDYGAVERKIRELAERFTPREIVFDRWEATGIMRALEEDGLPVFGHGQGFRDMAGSINELERAIIDRKLQHGGHPILRWNVANVAVTSDDAGNRKFTKAKAKELIDGAVALAMAIGRAHADEDTGSIYNDETARPDGLLIW